MVRIRPHGNDADSSCLMWAAESICDGRASWHITGLRCEAGAQTGWPRYIGRVTQGPAVLSDCQCAIVLNQFLRSRFQNDPVIIDSVSSADDSCAAAKGIINESNSRAKILFIWNLLQVDYVGHPYAWNIGHSSQVWTRIMSAIIAGQVRVIFPTQTQVQS